MRQIQRQIRPRIALVVLSDIISVHRLVKAHGHKPLELFGRERMLGL